MSKVIESSGQVINTQNFSEGSCKNQFGCSQKVRHKTMLYWATKAQISVKWRLLTCLCLLDSFSPPGLVLNITVWEGNFLLL